MPLLNDKARVSPRWDMYTRMIDGHLGSLRLNLGLNSWKREGDVKEIFFLFIRWKFFEGRAFGSFFFLRV